MLKRVPTGSLRLGMYIHAPEGSWFDYPDWRTRYLLHEEADLERLRESGIKYFVIDTDLGLDARPEHAASTAASPAAQSSMPTNACSAAEEFGRAGAVAEAARRSVQELLNDARLGKAIDVARTLPVIQQISQSIDRNSSALISYLRIKATDEYTYQHSVAVSALMINLGRQLLFDEPLIEQLGTAGLLLDIGKAALPVQLLQTPGALSPAEMAQVRQHPLRGAEMLGRSRGVPELAVDVCLHHHERFDGSGYPHRLKGEEISLFARMAAICDVYDARTSQRPYAGPSQPADVLSDMFGVRGQFDEQVLGAFIRSVGIYPVGSMVRLRSGQLALVVEQNAAQLTHPVVRPFYSVARRSPAAGEDIDLAKDGGDEILSRENPLRWGFANWDSMWPQMLRTRADGLATAA